MKADQLFNVAGRVAFVTGAASGLGFAMAEVMAENGAIVVVADINDAALEESCSHLRKTNATIFKRVLDVGDPDAVRMAVDDVVREHGRLDIAFVNAGVTAGPGYGTPEGRIENSSPELWDRSLRVNLTGAFVTMQAAATHMKAQRSGSIVVTTSIAALRASPMPGYGYHAAKAGLANIVGVAARDLAPSGVRVNGIAPGPFATNMANGRLRDPETAAPFVASVPMQRVGQPGEVKGLALLLASDASSYITGAIIPIDGGDTA